VLVWAIALSIFYLGSGGYGEAWHNPESWYILLGFLVMCTGIVVYYWYKGQEKSSKTDDSSDLSPKARILT